MAEINSKMQRIDSPPFYLTKPQPCPYLPNKLEQKLFTIVQGDNADNLNNLLSGCGFRRSQNIAYRPACDSCKACLSTRIPVKEFKPNKTQTRIYRKNADLLAWNMECYATSEQYSLFRDYIMSRHDDGGMANMSVLDYAMMIEETHVESLVREYRFKGIDSSMTETPSAPLKAVALTDILSDGISMVYSFYDTNEANRSLGTYMILDHIEQAKRLELDYVYLGYWVNNSPKMAYKSHFSSIEILTSDGWKKLKSVYPDL